MNLLDAVKRLFGSPPRHAEYPTFRTCVFLDTNIILEGKNLTELPWSEIDKVGPILVLLTPTVLSEIDSKKRDGRLGARAREFNRLIAPIASTGQPLALSSSPPGVTLALAMCERIPWGNYDDLDPQDADSRVIAEVLHARGVARGSRVVVSHDVKPISMATRHGLRTLHVSDNWLRPPEPSRSDREVQRLRAQLAELQKNEPELHFEIRPKSAVPVDAYQVPPLTQNQQKILLKGILRRNHPPPDAGPYEIFADTTLRSRYEEYKRETIPSFVAAYNTKLETLFNQVLVDVIISNRGNVRADNLVVKVSVSTGWLNLKAVYPSIPGPIAPRARDTFRELANLSSRIEPVRLPGKHEMHLAIEPERSKLMEVHCSDFRNNREWKLSLILWLDPSDASDCVFSVQATAANMHGEAAAVFEIAKTIRVTDAEALVNLDAGVLLQQPRVKPWLDDDINNRNFDRIELEDRTDEGA